METNEQGLTLEEKIMFSLLGIILIVAIGVLFVKSFSDNERVLVDTPITEKEGQQDDIDKEENTSKKDNNLIEVIPSINTSKNNSLLAAVSKKDASNKVTKTDSESSNSNENINDDIYSIWDFKESIVTESYSGEKIAIDKNVLLNNGTYAEAQVTVRKLIEDTYMIVDISEGFIISSPGTYKYYYTYANVTKELVLTVSDCIDTNDISFLNLKDEIIDDSIKKEEIDSIKEILKNTTMEITEKELNLTVKQTTTSSNQIPILLTLKNLEKIENAKSGTIGAIVTNENNIWHQSLLDNQIILWINIDMLNSKEIKINIDGYNYVLNINLNIEASETKDENSKEDSDAENDKDEIKDSQDEPKTEEENPKPDDLIDENENVENNNYNAENNIVATISESITESSSSIT